MSDPTAMQITSMWPINDSIEHTIPLRRVTGRREVLVLWNTSVFLLNKQHIITSNHSQFEMGIG